MENREIKFRAWNKSVKEMWDWEDIMTINDWEFGSGIFGDECRKEWYLMQYTGLKDKNGKEIYEGDWLEGKLRMGEVHFFNGCFYCWDERLIESIEEGDCEVVGNIYESPELLEE